MCKLHIDLCDYFSMLGICYNFAFTLNSNRLLLYSLRLHFKLCRMQTPSIKNKKTITLNYIITLGLIVCKHFSKGDCSKSINVIIKNKNIIYKEYIASFPDRQKKYVKFTSTSRVANFTCKQTAWLYRGGDGVEIQSDPSQRDNTISIICMNNLVILFSPQHLRKRKLIRPEQLPIFKRNKYTIF